MRRVAQFGTILKPATLEEVTLLHGYFSRFLNCSNQWKFLMSCDIWNFFLWNCLYLFHNWIRKRYVGVSYIYRINWHLSLILVNFTPTFPEITLTNIYLNSTRMNEIVSLYRRVTRIFLGQGNFLGIRALPQTFTYSTRKKSPAGEKSPVFLPGNS